MPADSDDEGENVKWEDIRLALETYKLKNNAMKISGKFTISPTAVDWPKSTLGMPLGKIMAKVRAKKIHTDRWDELTAMGYDLQESTEGGKHKYSYEVTYRALEIYKAHHSDLKVNSKFTVPAADAAGGGGIWPEEMAGMRLGLIVNSIRNAGKFKEHRGELELLGFDYTLQRAVGVHSFFLLPLSSVLYLSLS